ncbi:MAG TPA: IS1182 family transposase [Methylocella sp.]|nr:IS1182 family transposase [Methylocella sp.]
MMGRLEARQTSLFYDFCLEDHLPQDHLLRRVAAVLDLSAVRKQLAPYYSSIGRPSLDPELMIRMLLIGYLYGVRSERRLVEEVHLNLAYRWFCGLGLTGEVPERSSFSKTRHGRFRDSDAFRLVFESVVRTCLRAGLVGGDTFATDASVIEADARIARRVDGKELPEDWSDPARVTRPVREYLDELDKAAGLTSLPGEQPQPAKSLSLTDPTAALTSKGKSKITFAYGTNYLIDTQAAIIVDVEASPARWTAEVAATRVMIERAKERFDLRPKKLAADTAYGSGGNLAWLVAREIEPHIPVLDRTSQTNGVFTRNDFIFDRDNNTYICPGGKSLPLACERRDNGILIYRASSLDCAGCSLKKKCTTAAYRSLSVNAHEEARQHVASLAGTEAFKKSARERRKAEMLFAHLKRNLNFRRLRLRGFTGARDEFTLAATAQNLRKLVKLIGFSPPESLGACTEQV